MTAPSCRGSLDELSFAAALLRFLSCPLIRDPMPYAGGQGKRFRSAPGFQKLTSEAGGKQTKAQPPTGPRGSIPVNPPTVDMALRCGRKGVSE